MALATDRVMPVVYAIEEDGLWWVHLPAGREVSVTSTDDVRRLVAAEACGAAIKWEPEETEAELRMAFGK